jgi:two-component system cell cycle sensor histidine kinase/response regulator CckA
MGGAPAVPLRLRFRCGSARVRCDARENPLRGCPPWVLKSEDMLKAGEADGSIPASGAADDSEQRIQTLSDRVERLQAEVATLRARHLRSDEHDVGIGSLLTEREASFSEVERLANVGSWSWDVRTNEVVWSEQAFRIFGYDPAVDKATRDAFFAALHPDDRKFLENASGRTAATGITAPAPRARFVHADGSVRHVILTGTPIRDQTGQLIRIVGAALDVTEFVAVESELRRTAQLLNEAERIAGLGSWNLLTSGDEIEWSDTMYRIFGIEPGTKITQETFFGRIHPEDRDLVRSSGPCLGNDSGRAIEFRVLWSDGSLRHVCMEVSAERDDRGRIVRLMGTVQDITTRVQLEHQLRHSQKMDAIGTFAGGIAHDFNNYLMVIKGNVELVRARSTPGSFECGRLEEIATAAGSCAALTGQLLSLARRQVSAPSLVDVVSRVSSAAPVLRRLLGDHIQLVLVEPGGDAVVRIDPAQLEQVLVNLAVNARDAMPEGGAVTIRVDRTPIEAAFTSSRPTLSPGEYIRISVKDTGVGIPAAIRSRVFEPFFTTKEQGKGTGLGLSTVYGIVKQWRGHVEFETHLGRGTEFCVWLPAHAGPADSRPGAAPPMPAVGRETVLLAEDEPLVRDLIRTVLEEAGYTVLAAEDGQHALRVAQQTAQLDLLVSDVRMPHVGGVELARRLRVGWPELEVILMSGYPDIDAVNAQENGLGGALLAKPFGTADLLDRVRRALDRRERPARLDAEPTDGG